MKQKSTSKPSNSDLSLQRAILTGRTFSLGDILGQEAGSFMKGDSPVPPLLQATTTILLFIDQNIADSPGALQATLKTWVKRYDTRVSCHLKAPLKALTEIVELIVSNQEFLYEFVREVDVQWGEIYGERPHFQQPGQPPHPDDEYTHDSVSESLKGFLAKLEANSPNS